MHSFTHYLGAAVLGGAQTITPDPVTIPIVVTVIPAIQGLLNRTFTPSPVTMQLVVPAPAQLGGHFTWFPASVTMPLVVPAPLIAINVIKTPSALAMPLIAPAPVVIPTLVITATSLIMPLTVPAPTINVVLVPSAVTIPLILPIPLVDFAGLVYTSIGRFFLYTAAEWAVGTTFQLDATFRSSSGGEVGIRLFNTTLSGAVAGSTITKTNTSLARHRSSVFALRDGNEYRLQVGIISGATGALISGTIVALSP